MPVIINRTTKSINVSITSGTAESDAFDMSEYTTGQVRIPNAWTAASIGFKLGASLGVTFRRSGQKEIRL